VHSTPALATPSSVHSSFFNDLPPTVCDVHRVKRSARRPQQLQRGGARQAPRHH
jgi:hypothetical protein